MVTTANDLLSCRTAELDDLFRAGTVAPVPDGPGRGTVIQLGGTPAARVLAGLGSLFWKGKQFDAASVSLQNLLSPARLRAIRATVLEGNSWLDGQPCLVLDYSRTSLVAKPIRDEIRQIAPGLWLGLVFMGRRRVPVHFALSFD
jgi:hypothetical protein